MMEYVGGERDAYLMHMNWTGNKKVRRRRKRRRKRRRSGGGGSGRSSPTTHQ